MVRVGIAVFLYQAVLILCKPEEVSHVDEATLVESINSFMGSSHTTPTQVLPQHAELAMPPSSFADVSAHKALAFLRSDASVADQGTSDAITDFLGGLADDVPTPQPLVPEVAHHVKQLTESVAQVPKRPEQRGAVKAREAPSKFQLSKKAASPMGSKVMAVVPAPIGTKLDRAELKTEMMAQLKSELTKEIIDELKHNHSAPGHVADTVSPVAMSEASVIRPKQSHAKVADQSKPAATHKEASIATTAREASLLKTSVGTKKESSHTKVAAHKHEQVNTAVHSRAVVRKTQRLKVTFDTEDATRSRNAVPVRAVEEWFSTAPVSKMRHQVPKHASLASTSSSHGMKFERQIHELQSELLVERALREEAAAVASKKTGRPEGDWSPAAPQSSALGDWRQQVSVLEAELQQERLMREEAADAAEHATLASERLAVPAPAMATAASPISMPVAPKGLPLLPWQHAPAEYPVMSVVAGDQPLRTSSTPQGFFAAARKPPQGFLAVVRDSFAWITGGRLRWLFVGAVPKAAPKATELTQIGSLAPTSLRLGHSLQFPATRQQAIAKVAAATRRDKLQSISLGTTFLEMEAGDEVDEENLKHSDAYMRSTAETAELPHVMSEQERADRRRESVHISDVWSNLEQQDSDIEQTLDSMGPETNLNKMGELDSIQDQSMAALTRQVDSAGETARDPQLRILSNVVSSDFVHDPFEQLQLSDEDAEKRIRFDPNMRRE